MATGAGVLGVVFVFKRADQFKLAELFVTRLVTANIQSISKCILKTGNMTLNEQPLRRSIKIKAKQSEVCCSNETATYTSKLY